MSILDRGWLGALLGRGGASITVPILDGALRPNNILEEAELYAELAEVDGLAVEDNALFASAGHQVLKLGTVTQDIISEFDSPISCLANAPGGGLVVGLEDGTLQVISGPHEGFTMSGDSGPGVTCPVALSSKDENTLIVAEGSRHNGAAGWARDLLEKNASGRLLGVDVSGSGKTEILADRLAWPHGIVCQEDELIYTESWRHRLMATPAAGGGNIREISAHMPGYPGRLSAAVGGGYWLAVFAMRTQLLEFVLGEDQYRHAMLESVPPEHWIVPALAARENFRDPLQAGGVIQLGIKKPWAPPRSYGLVIKLDSEFRPVSSLHSRVGGVRHGITAAVEMDGNLYIASKGSGAVLKLGLDELEGMQ